MREIARLKRKNMGNFLVAVMVPGTHRSAAGDGYLQRRAAANDESTLGREREVVEKLGRTGNSPGS
jgi:hypothetical protein